MTNAECEDVVRYFLDLNFHHPQHLVGALASDFPEPRPAALCQQFLEAILECPVEERVQCQPPPGTSNPPGADTVVAQAVRLIESQATPSAGDPADGVLLTARGKRLRPAEGARALQEAAADGLDVR